MMALSVRRSERGVTLAEVLIALFILGFVGVAVIAGVFTTVKGNDTARTRITAESLARSELEYVNSQAYTTLYPGTPTSSSWDYTLPRDPPDPPRWDSLHNGLPWDYAGYEITVSSAEKATGIQKITAVVRDVNKDVDILTIETYRAKY